MMRSRRTPHPFWRNMLALIVASLAVGVAHVNSDPTSIGGAPLARAASTAPPVVAVPPSPSLPEPIPAEATDDQAAETSAPQQSPAVAEDHPLVLRGIWGLKFTAALLEKGCDSFSKVPDYTATMFKQERIGGALGEGQTIDLKLRHEPFSVYMKWLSGDRGRQLIFVEGQNEGNMLVQPGGIKGRLTGVLSVDPTGTLAMSEARYPITKAGLLELARIILDYQRADIARGRGYRAELRDDQTFDNRPCYLSICEYDAPEFNPMYRKSVVFIDKELSMPICVKNYTWARDANPETIDEETLVEFYAYTELRMAQQLGSVDFDQNNSSYKLRVKR